MSSDEAAWLSARLVHAFVKIDTESANRVVNMLPFEENQTLIVILIVISAGERCQLSTFMVEILGIWLSTTHEYCSIGAVFGFCAAAS